MDEKKKKKEKKVKGIWIIGGVASSTRRGKRCDIDILPREKLRYA